MKSIIVIFAAIAVANAGVVQVLPASTTLLRTPSLDSAIVRSQQVNGGFSYSTVENHAYAPVVQTVSLGEIVKELKFKLWCFSKYPVLRQIAFYPQVPQIYYPGSVLSIYPGIYPSIPGIQVAGGIPFAGGVPGVAPGVNPQNPVEVEDPADNLPNEPIKQGDDEDTVSIDSA
jgi:hypothetical protein